MSEKTEKEAKSKGTSRREFIAATGAAVAGLAVGAAIGSQAFPRVVEVPGPVKTVTTTTTATTIGTVTVGPVTATIFPESKGYIFYDPKKCGGCRTCMLACSLVHEGKNDLSLSRIQILDDPFGQYPTDLSPCICRQCPDAPCVKACPVPGALYIDKDYMNVRAIDESKCIGCKLCITACPFAPSMVVWKPATKKVAKCDLCKDTPYWGEKGKLACVEACPDRALKFSTEPPRVPGPDGYIVNLRGDGWKKLDLPVE